MGGAAEGREIERYTWFIRRGPESQGWEYSCVEMTRMKVHLLWEIDGVDIPCEPANGKAWDKMGLG